MPTIQVVAPQVVVPTSGVGGDVLVSALGDTNRSDAPGGARIDVGRCVKESHAPLPKPKY